MKLPPDSVPRRRRAASQSPRAFAAVLRGIGLGIVAGEFPVGQTLPGKDVLMRRFSVSNTALREALKTLEAKGMVAARTKVGYWVTDKDNWNLLDETLLGWQLEVGADSRFIGRLFEMRQSIEPTAAALAALRRNEAHIVRLLSLAEAMANAGLDRQRFTETDLAFHQLILEASGNPMMRSIGALIGAALAASFQLSAPTDSLQELSRAHDQHLAIAEAIIARNPQAAADAMMAVIEQGW
ncbi:MAG TPA: FadR/GntR family transcriptional regulator, partial [Pararhizobium sp.]|nr:FadR/GntR family transcriptional regulator [Pararhizobium sp.]